MTVEHIEVIVEEPSVEAALRLLLPAIIGGTSFEVYSHQGKGELLQPLPERLRGYARWLLPTWRVLVVVDRDDDDCVKLKSRLEKIASEAGLRTRSRARGGPFAVVNRIAIEELEAWYFGDWVAVRSAYPRVSESVPAKARYRDPDAVSGGIWEALERLFQGVGYFRSGLRKIEAARRIAPHMDPQRNTSRSFQALRMALLEMTD